MRIPAFATFTRFLAATLLICSLVACNADPDSSGKRAKPAKAQVAADDYVKHLAITQITSEKSDTTVEAINSFATKKTKKSTPQGLVVLEYEIDGKSGTQKLAAPITLAGKSTSFPELLEIMKILSAKKYTLHNLHVAKASITPDKSLKLPEKDKEAAEAMLIVQEQKLLGSARALPPHENIDTQLHLIKFFIDHRMRDAAYIAADNVKQALAGLPESDAKAQNFLKELEQLEGRMRETMPFTL